MSDYLERYDVEFPRVCYTCKNYHPYEGEAGYDESSYYGYCSVAYSSGIEQVRHTDTCDRHTPR